jgi:hypothetical protein
MNQNQAWINQYSKEAGTRESVSGYGSSLENTAEIRQALPFIFSRYGIKSVVDMPCGDWNWMKEVDLGDVKYTGLDIVPAMIANNTHNYGAVGIDFAVHDAVNDIPPKADLIICRDFLFHIPNSKVHQVLENVANSGCQFILTTLFPKILNEDIQDDSSIRWRKINLCAHPFNFPEPEYIIQENDSDACQGRIVGLFRLEQ